MRVRSHGNVISSSNLAAVRRLNEAERKDLREARGNSASGNVRIYLADGTPSNFKVKDFKINLDSVSYGPDGKPVVLAWEKTKDGRKQGLVKVEDLKLDPRTRQDLEKKLRSLPRAPNTDGREVLAIDRFDSQQIRDINFYSPTRHAHRSQIAQARALAGDNRVLAQSLPNQPQGGGSRTHLDAGTDFHPSKVKVRQYDTEGEGKGRDFVEWTYGWVEQGGKKIHGWLITGYQTPDSIGRDGKVGGFHSLLGD